MKRKHEIITYFTIGFVIGLVIFLTFGSHRETKFPKVGGHLYMVLPNNRCFHIHHWIICSVSLILILILAFSFQCRFNILLLFLMGFLTAGTLDGLLYHDRFDLMERCSIGKFKNKNDI